MSAKKSKRNSRRRDHARGNVQDPVLRGAAMNGTSTETSTHSMDDAPSPTAEEAASAYEQASAGGDAPAESRPPEDTTPDVASSGPASDAASGAASREPATLTSGSVPAEVSIDTAVPSSDTTVSSEDAPPSIAARDSSPVIPQPGTLPVPRMNLQNNLRLRMKVWTDPRTLKRYLMPMAFMRDLMNGQPVTDVMYAYAMSDDNTRVVTLTAAEWNALPFFYFQEDGHAPRAAARPMDALP